MNTITPARSLVCVVLFFAAASGMARGQSSLARGPLFQDHGARTGAGLQTPPPAPIAATDYRQDENDSDDPHTKAHARNFLDCVKSRKSPVADITTAGFHVTLPCLLGRLSVKEGRSFGWDGKKAVPV